VTTLLSHPVDAGVVLFPKRIRFSKICFRELFVKADGNLVEAGDVVTNPKLARTFRRIAENPFAFYNGSLAQDIVDDVKDYGR